MPDTPIEPSPSGRYPLDMESCVAVLEQIARDTAATLARLERCFDAVDRRFDAMDRRFDAMERRIDMVAAKQQADFRWLLGVMFSGFSATIAGFAAMLGVMAHGFHWL